MPAPSTAIACAVGSAGAGSSPEQGVGDVLGGEYIERAESERDKRAAVDPSPPCQCKAADYEKKDGARRHQESRDGIADQPFHAVRSEPASFDTGS